MAWPGTQGKGHRVAGGVAALALGLAGATASGLGSAASGEPQVSSGSGVPQPAATGTPPDPQLAQAVAAWISQGGEADLKALAADFGALEKAAAGEDMAAVAASCRRLAVDVKAAQAYAPIPDPQAQSSWAAALADYAAGAGDCASGATAVNTVLLDRASTEITTGSNELNRVTVRMTQIAGR